MLIPAISPIGSAASIGSSSSASGVTGGGQFASMLTNALNGVNQSVAQSQQQGISLAAGTAPSLSQVMVSATQAQLAVDLTVQVRDRVVQAYNQVINMQV